MLPRGDEYSSAVQNPHVAFTDPELRLAQVDTTPLGLPQAYSGGFTVTFKSTRAGQSYAIRCFTRDVQDLNRRYQAIGRFFINHSSTYFIAAHYLQDGIRVNGKAYPIIKMPWLQGEPLNIYLARVYQQKEKVENILTDFVRLIHQMEQLGIAHGDLQQGNIIVKNDKLFLIDYDGMYVPDLNGLGTNEIGHINYQHPGRKANHFNDKIDRFSAMVIYTGLKALTLKPGLWRTYDNGENLLFKAKDFADLKQSALISELLGIAGLKLLVERLIGCCYLPFTQLPSLDQFLQGTFSYDRNAAGTITINRNQYPLLNASKSSSILERFGEKVEVIGKISGKYAGNTFSGAPYMFLNFGAFPNQTFTLVVWSGGIAALTAKGWPPANLIGQWISVTGVITSYSGKPQMIIEQASQLQVLGSDTEARQRLQYKPGGPTVNVTTPPTRPKPVEPWEAKVFNDLYKGRSTSQPPPAPAPPIRATPRPPTVKTTPPKSEKGCTIPVICVIIGAVVMGALSDGKLWFVGVVIGLFIGNLINRALD